MTNVALGWRMQPAFRKASSLYIYMPLELSGQIVYVQHKNFCSGSVDNVMSLCHLRYVGRKGRSRYLAFETVGPYHVHGCLTLPWQQLKTQPIRTKIDVVTARYVEL